tara:strand:+ start:2317 stop:2901 length:585 start_codon:yes stop_codon:yes gene_type:complete
MDDPDVVKRLLDGNIEPSEIEGNPRLFAMAERIYGREGLEELGVSAPIIETPAIPQEVGVLPQSVSLPDFQPELDILKSGEKLVAKGTRRFVPLSFGVLGILGVGFNLKIGVGWVLCSTGVADMREICSEGNTKAIWNKTLSWDSLHQAETWAQPMEIGMADGVLLTLFSLLTLIGFFVKKKSVHTGDILPPLG